MCKLHTTAYGESNGERNVINQMELEWLMDFVSLAKTGSFSKAAEHRNISQSAFSRRIRALEHWLGTALIDRHTHPVSLTDAGSQLVGAASQVIRTIYKTREDYGKRRVTGLRNLSIGVADHLSIHFAPAWLKQVAPMLGDRKIQLVTGLKAGLGFVDLLKQQKLDFLLAYGGSVNSEDRDTGLFESMVLDHDQLVPVCSADMLHDKAIRFPATSEKPLPFVSFMPGSAMANMVNGVAARRGSTVHLKTLIETGTSETIKALVLSGFGIAWLPRLAIQRELQSGSLCELGDTRHRVPFSIELYRYTANIHADTLLMWENLKPDN